MAWFYKLLTANGDYAIDPWLTGKDAHPCKELKRDRGFVKDQIKCSCTQQNKRVLEQFVASK